MAKKSNQQHLSEAIKDLIETYRLKGGMQQIQIHEVWNNIVGEYVAKQTEKVEIKNHQLLVKIKIPALRQEIMMAKSKLINNINQQMGERVINDMLVY